MKIIRILLLVIVMLLVIPRSIKADESGTVQFYIEGQAGGAALYQQRIFFMSTFSTAEKALFLFDNLFEPCDPIPLSAIPKKARLNRVKFLNGDLTVDVTSAMLQYGGNRREMEILVQLLSTAFSLQGVERFTLFVEGTLQPLPESTILLEYTRDDYYFLKESMGYE